ncbi:MAG: recombinase family protein [Clostridia bacterium]|nr:recombinase family protein [Clostridia bacterium]
MAEQNRVCCLYRVSTDKQVDYDNNHEADIPMQRKACRKFAEQMGWNIVHEEQEDGVSGHKVRAENRDEIQTIKGAVKKQRKEKQGLSEEGEPCFLDIHRMWKR